MPVRLETVRVSRASSEQRCGRAGRLGPGVCHRLWPEHEQQHLHPQAEQYREPGDAQEQRPEVRRRILNLGDDPSVCFV